MELEVCGGLGKAGGSVRQRTNKSGGLEKVWEGPGRRGGGRAGWVAPKSESCELDANSLKSAKRDGGLDFWASVEAWNL